MIASSAALYHTCIGMAVSIACPTKLEVFQCPERKNIKNIVEKKKEEENHHLDRF